MTDKTADIVEERTRFAASAVRKGLPFALVTADEILRDLAARQLDEAADEIARLREMLSELHDLVWGECPSLLNEDSGGDAGLDLRINAALEDKP